MLEVGWILELMILRTEDLQLLQPVRALLLSSMVSVIHIFPTRPSTLVQPLLRLKQELEVIRTLVTKRRARLTASFTPMLEHKDLITRSWQTSSIRTLMRELVQSGTNHWCHLIPIRRSLVALGLLAPGQPPRVHWAWEPMLLLAQRLGIITAAMLR